MLSAADTMADNYRMQEEAERQERERVYKRKMLEEAMAQKKKAEEEAQLQYKRQQQKAKDDAFVNYAVTGNVPFVPSVPSVPSYTNSGTPAKKKTNVPNSTTVNPPASPAYIPTSGGEASAAFYRFNANAATDEDKNNLIVSDKLPPFNYQKQVFNTDISYEGVQQLLDSGYTEDQIGDMTTEEKIEKLIDIDRKQAKDNVVNRKQDIVDARNGLADWGNIIQLKKREKASAKSTDDMFDKLDARIAVAQANVDAELKALTPELNRLTNMGYIEEKKKRIQAVRDKYGLDNLLKQREEISAELKRFNAMYGDEYREAFFENNQEGDAKFREEKEEAWQKRIKPLVDDYNRKIAEQYQLVPLLPDVTAENVTPEEVSEEYKRLRKDGGIDYFTTTEETVPLKADDPRYVRYKDIKEAEAKGEFNKVYNLLTEEERKRFFPNYDPKKQREFNYRYELKKKAEAEKDALPNEENYLKLSDVQKAIIKAKQGIPLTDTESAALQEALGIEDATAAYNKAKAYDNDTLKEFGISPAQNKVFGKLLMEEYGTRLKAENEAAKKAQVPPSNKTPLAELRERNYLDGYVVTSKDVEEVQKLMKLGLSQTDAVILVLKQKEATGNYKTTAPQEIDGLLVDRYGAAYKTLKNTEKQSLANLYAVWAKGSGVLGNKQLAANATTFEKKVEYVKKLRQQHGAWQKAVEERGLDIHDFPSPVAKDLFEAEQDLIAYQILSADEIKKLGPKPDYTGLLERKYSEGAKKYPPETIKKITKYAAKYNENLGGSERKPVNFLYHPDAEDFVMNLVLDTGLHEKAVTKYLLLALRFYADPQKAGKKLTNDPKKNGGNWWYIDYPDKLKHFIENYLPAAYAQIQINDREDWKKKLKTHKVRTESEEQEQAQGKGNTNE
jgi:uncharacterized protein YoaH (UPF0181 family)